MKSLLLRAAGSCKTEVKIILGVIAVLMILPAVVVVAVADSGIAAVSGALAALNPVTHQVEVRDPNGNITAKLSLTTVWPATGRITQEFGIPNPPYELHHSGIDIAGKKYDPITPFMAGKVTKAGAITTGCGKCVYIDHGNNITSSYSHLTEVKVTAGQEVKPGDVIGLEGDTGWAFGDHLHFMIMVYSIPVDPRTFMVGNPELKAP
jgi:murein DD-endopeptidase MepM/ murein hydrolase activator NlpD